MYELNLLIIVLLFPVLAFHSVRHLSKRTMARALIVCFGYASPFTYLSTFYGFSFEINILDTVSINVFLLSLFAVISWRTFYLGVRSWLQILILSGCSIVAFILYNVAFGPSEACGQRFPENTFYDEKYVKITHAGYNYGLLDYGSRFLVYKKQYGLERIIGVAENANQYYNKVLNISLIEGEQFLSVTHLDHENQANIDTFHIHKPY